MTSHRPGQSARVSIVMPVLDGLEFIDEAVASVRAQTFSSWELLVVDDGSTDGSAERAQAYAADDPDRIRYFEHAGHQNLGQTASRNLALGAARGEYVAFLDADDYWEPDKLARQCDILDTEPRVAMVYNPYFLWFGWTGRDEDVARDVRGEIGDGTWYGRVVEPPQMLVQQIDRETGFPAPVSALVRRAVIEEVGGFEPTFPGMYDDESFFTKICVNHPVYVISDCLDRYRQHDNSFCARAIREGTWQRDPAVASPDRVRLVRWQYDYVRDHAQIQRTELLAALTDKLNRLGGTGATSAESPSGGAQFGPRSSGLRARVRRLPFRRTRTLLAEIQQTRILLDEELRSVANRMTEIQRQLDVIGARLEESHELAARGNDGVQKALAETTRVFDLLRFVADEEAGNRRRLWAARAQPGYEAAYTDPKPLVSVVIPTYQNWQALRDRSLPSILGQSYTNFEVIVVGETSPAETHDVIRDLADPRIRYVNLNRRGPYPSDVRALWHVAGTPNANEGIRIASGQWLAFCDDDDALRPEHLRTLLDAARHHRAEVCYGLMEWHMPSKPRTLGTFPPVHGDFGHQAAIVHAGLKWLVFEMSAALLDEPGDWHWCRRLLSAGARFQMIDEIVCDVYPTVREWHE